MVTNMDVFILLWSMSVVAQHLSPMEEGFRYDPPVQVVDNSGRFTLIYRNKYQTYGGYGRIYNATADFSLLFLRNDGRMMLLRNDQIPFNIEIVYLHGLLYGFDCSYWRCQRVETYQLVLSSSRYPDDESWRLYLADPSIASLYDFTDIHVEWGDYSGERLALPFNRPGTFSWSEIPAPSFTPHSSILVVPETAHGADFAECISGRRLDLSCRTSYSYVLNPNRSHIIVDSYHVLEGIFLIEQSRD